jgi:hypothetical protein
VLAAICSAADTMLSVSFIKTPPLAVFRLGRHQGKTWVSM